MPHDHPIAADTQLHTNTVYDALLARAPRQLAWHEQRDIAAWRPQLDAALRRCLGEAPVGDATNAVWGEPRPMPGGTRQPFQFTSEPGVIVPGWLCRPAGVTRPPVMCCLQGHSTGMHLSIGEVVYPKDAKAPEGDRNFAVRALAEGFAAVVIEQRGFGLRRDHRHGEPENPSPTCNHAGKVATLLGRSLVGDRIHDLRRTIDLLSTRDDLDIDRLACLGQSGGGTVTWYAAAIEPRLKAIMPSCAICPFVESIGWQEHCIDNYLPSAFTWFDLPDIAGLIAPRPAVIVAGRDDGLFPIDATQRGFETIRSIYAAADAPDACVLVVGDGGHRFYADQAWPRFRALTGW